MAKNLAVICMCILEFGQILWSAQFMNDQLDKLISLLISQLATN